MHEPVYVTPRGWSSLGEELFNLPEDQIQSVVAGAVGDKAAAEFMAFRQAHGDLPSPKEADHAAE